MGTANDRGLLLYRQKRYAPAADEFRRELSADTGSVMAHAMLGLSLLFAGDRAGAEAEVGEAMRLGPDRAYPHYAAACVTLRPPKQTYWARLWIDRQGFDPRRTRAARDQVLRAVAIEPFDADYLGLLAACEFDLHDWPAAEAACRRGLAARPDHVRCGTLLGRTLAATGRAAEADRVLAGVLAGHPESASAHLARGWLSIEGGDAAGAESHVRESLRLDPMLPHSLAVLRRARWAGVPVVAGVSRLARRLNRRMVYRPEPPVVVRVVWAAGVLAAVLAVSAGTRGWPWLLAPAVALAAVAVTIGVRQRRAGREGGPR